MKTAELRQKDVAALQTEVLELSKELFNLRMQNAVNQLNRNHLVKQARRNIARVKTILAEKENEGK